MILKRLEKDNKIKSMYNSSTVYATTFDTITKDLTVIFNNGGQYKYPSVALTDYTRLEISESTGADFNTHIKKKYTNFEKLPSLTPTELEKLKTLIDELIAEDNKASIGDKTKAMVEGMHKVIGGYINNGKIEYDVLRKLETSIAEYNKVANPQPSQPVAV